MELFYEAPRMPGWFSSHLCTFHAEINRKFTSHPSYRDAHNIKLMHTVMITHAVIRVAWRWERSSDPTIMIAVRFSGECFSLFVRSTVWSS